MSVRKVTQREIFLNKVAGAADLFDPGQCYLSMHEENQLVILTAINQGGIRMQGDRPIAMNVGKTVLVLVGVMIVLIIISNLIV